VDCFVPRNDGDFLRHCEAEGRGNLFVRAALAWIASCLAMTGIFSVIARPKAVAISLLAQGWHGLLRASQ
jgi:hypothetical protein